MRLTADLWREGNSSVRLDVLFIGCQAAIYYFGKIYLDHYSKCVVGGKTSRNTLFFVLRRRPLTGADRHILQRWY